MEPKIEDGCVDLVKVKIAALINARDRLRRAESDLRWAAKNLPRSVTDQAIFGGPMCEPDEAAVRALLHPPKQDAEAMKREAQAWREAIDGLGEALGLGPDIANTSWSTMVETVKSLVSATAWSEGYSVASRATLSNAAGELAQALGTDHTDWSDLIDEVADLKSSAAAGSKARADLAVVLGVDDGTWSDMLEAVKALRGP